MSHVQDAAELKAVAEDFGLRVSDLRSSEATSRFVIALDHGTDSDRVFVHASPTRMSISLDLTDGASEALSYDEALEKMLEAIGQ
ncbi:MAG: hypothetical protein U9N56_09805 [Actinomycetota bacterium]|nr:hypothetical protein [Actinomycetota bacterium]